MLTRRQSSPPQLHLDLRSLAHNNHTMETPRERASNAIARWFGWLLSLPRRILCGLGCIPIHVLQAIGSALGGLLIAMLERYEKWAIKFWYITRIVFPFAFCYWFFNHLHGKPTPLSPVPLLTAATCEPFRSMDGDAKVPFSFEASGLGASLLAAAGASKVLIVTASNTTFAPLTANLQRAIGGVEPALPPLFVTAGDDAEAARLAAQGMHAHAATGLDSLPGVPPMPSKAARGWHGSAVRKWATARTALSEGLDVLLLDSDAVPLRNPFSYIATLGRSSSCDAYFTTDATPYLGGSSGAWYPRERSGWLTSLWGRPVTPNYVSAGFVLLRASARTQSLAEDMVRLTAAIARDPTGGAAATEWERMGAAAAAAADGADAPGAAPPAAVVPGSGVGAVGPRTRHPLDSEEGVLNAVMQRRFEADAAGSNPVPSLGSTGNGCANVSAAWRGACSVVQPSRHFKPEPDSNIDPHRPNLISPHPTLPRCSTAP